MKEKFNEWVTWHVKSIIGRGTGGCSENEHRPPSLNKDILVNAHLKKGIYRFFADFSLALQGCSFPDPRAGNA